MGRIRDSANVLGLLVLQNSAVPILYKIMQRTSAEEPHACTLLLCAECLKLVCSLLAWGMGPKDGDQRVSLQRVIALVPIAATYGVQNKLILLAISTLDAHVFQLLSNTKLLAAGVTGAVVFRRMPSPQQWVALVLLTAGAALVNMQGTACADGTVSATGVSAVLASAVLSGAIGTYTELMLKHNAMHMWLQSAVVAGMSALMFVGAHVAEGVSLQAVARLPPAAVAVIVNNAVGGLVVVAVLKRTDNVTKGYAVTCALLLTTGLSRLLLSTPLTPVFGVALVVVACSLYLNANACEQKT